MKTEIEIGNLSDVGKVRTVNEDYFGNYSGKFGKLIIVCDGMGGHKGGALASRLAVESIKEHFEKLTSDFNVKDELRIALQSTDKVLKERANESEDFKEMGSTAVVLLLKGDQAFIAHIGDSRIYLIRNGQIHRLTKDHSIVQQMIDANLITEEAAKDHPKKNVITRSLGADNNSEPEIAEPISVFRKDKFIFCTDGLTGYVNDIEILESVIKYPIQNACSLLVELANHRGGKDNITIQIVGITKGKRLPIQNPLKNKKIKRALISIVLLFLLITTVYIFLPSIDSSNNEDDGYIIIGDSTHVEKHTESIMDTLSDTLLPKENDSLNIIIEGEIK